MEAVLSVGWKNDAVQKVLLVHYSCLIRHRFKEAFSLQGSEDVSTATPKIMLDSLKLELCSFFQIEQKLI